MVATHPTMRRPTETRLRRAFADVLTAVLATSAGAMAVAGGVGCGGSTAGTEGGGTSNGGTSNGGVLGYTSMCDDIPGKSFLQGLRASPELDGAVSRSESAFVRQSQDNPGGNITPAIDEQGDAWQATEHERVGTLCASATDQAACLDKVKGYRVLPSTREACLAQFPGGGYSSNVCNASYILYTRGDEIGVARNTDEIRALAGTFDTLEEAMWVATNAGYERTCGPRIEGAVESRYRRTDDGGWELTLLEAPNCGKEQYTVVVHVDYAGNLTVVSKERLPEKPSCAMAGRRPEGLRLDSMLAQGADEDAIGRHFAAMATLEAASVTAFRRLHRQLAAFGAPRELLDRIRTAARDEIRHARATTALARKYGVTPAAPQISACNEAASLFTIALENAREGCVRETFGALVAHLQTSRAGDADVRATMAEIAGEETEHAALSWDIATWIEAQLGDDERAVLAKERRDAFVTLASELAAPVDPRVVLASGVPGGREAVRMLEALEPLMLAAA